MEQKGFFIKFSVSIQVLQPGTKVLLRNSAQDGRKGGKLQERWLGPYIIIELIGKGVYKIKNPKTGRDLKKGVNVCRLKIYHEPQSVSKECSNPVTEIIVCIINFWLYNH